MKQIARGNLDKTLSLQTGDEIEQLADSVNNMTAALKTHIADLSKMTAEKERITAELSVARHIQEGMLPKTFPAFPDKTEFDIYASMQAAKEVGGDFYDFYLVDEDHLAVTIGDVSGKGVPAALFMVVARTVLQNNTLLLKSLISLYIFLNENISTQKQGDFTKNCILFSSNSICTFFPIHIQ